MLVSENLHSFQRGQDTKKSLDVGYKSQMKEISKKLLDEVANTNQDLQPIEVNVDPRGFHKFDNNEPVYSVEFSLEGGHGLPDDYPGYFYITVHINPFSAEASVSVVGQYDNYHIYDKETGNMENIEYDTDPISLNGDISVENMARHINHLVAKELNNTGLDSLLEDF